MSQRIRAFFGLTGVFILILFLTTALGPAASGAADQKTKPKPSAGQAYDPCLPIKQIKQMAGDPNSIDCLPLKIEITWDVDERVFRASGMTDQVKFTLVEEYGAYLYLLYDSGKRKKLISMAISGPEPEVERFINARFVKIQGRILGCRDLGGSNCREYDIPAQELAVTVIKAATVDEDGDVQCGFSASWDEMGDVREAGLNTSQLSLAFEQIIPKDYYVYPKLLHVVETGRFGLKADAEKALSYDDFAKLWEVGELVKYFSEKYQSPGSIAGHKIDQYARSVEATVKITSGEAKKEKWNVIVEGRESDDTRPPLIYNPGAGVKDQHPISVSFEWKLIGNIVLAKRKNRYSFDSGRVSWASCDSKVIQITDLFDCRKKNCPDAPEPGSLMGRVLSGGVEGQNLRISWPEFNLRECVECNLKPGSKGNAPPYKMAFGSNMFVTMASGVAVPIRDGATAKGTFQGMSCTVTLKKVS